MRAKHVHLKPEVTRNDAFTIMQWMEDPEVTQYLNESSNISSEIYQAINRVNLYFMTHLFNKSGRFFIVCKKDKDHPVGFIRLVHKGNEAEMVAVIGERKNWGQGFGSAAIQQALQFAFFEWRSSRVNAIIDTKNCRSVKAFVNAGFKFEKDLTNSKLFSITMNDYISRQLGQGGD